MVFILWVFRFLIFFENFNLFGWNIRFKILFNRNVGGFFVIRVVDFVFFNFDGLIRIFLNRDFVFIINGIFC